MSEPATLQTLERLIDQQIALGQKNPHDFYPLLENLVGDDLLEIAKPYLADFVAEMARQRLNNQRRHAVARITPKSVATGEVMLKSLWVPDPGHEGITYKRIADMTADDFDARASYLERMMIGISRHAAWCRSVANDIRSHNAVTAGNLESLPELPSADDL